MKKNKNLIISLVCFALFIFFTIIVRFVDRRPLGPNSSLIGLATVNVWFSELIGSNMMLYKITDFVSILPILTALVFAGVGVYQWATRKELSKVDKSIWILGCFYIALFAIYMIFNFVVINSRPVLIDGYLEPSYPSSTTLLSITFMLFAIYQSNRLLSNQKLKTSIEIGSWVLMLFLVIGRIISGVHWLSDILASIILSIAIVYLYYYLAEEKELSINENLTEVKTSSNADNETLPETAVESVEKTADELSEETKLNKIEAVNQSDKSKNSNQEISETKNDNESI